MRKKKQSLIFICIITALLLISCSDKNPFTGKWQCVDYAMLMGAENEEPKWYRQNDEFTQNFSLTLKQDETVVVSSFGNENEGKYNVKDDTLYIQIKGSESVYVFHDDYLVLINNPRAKIVYKKENEE